MSELPNIVDLDIPTSQERYERHFGVLPVQAVLNMLIAYRPENHTTGTASRRKVLATGMEAIYSSLLTSTQSKSGQIDLQSIGDETLGDVSGYLWNLAQMKKFQNHRTPNRMPQVVVDQSA